MSIPPYPKGDIGRLVKRHLREGDVALDVGACKGEITQFMLKAVGASGRVIAVEPDRRSAADLQELYPQLTVIGAAAWSSACELTIYRNQHPDQSSLFHELVRDWSEKGAVPAISLDEVTENIPTVALVKIDAQGAEPEILKGARQLLQKCGYWIIEVWPQGLKQTHSSPLALYEQLVDAGLTVCWANDAVVQRADLAEWAAKPTYVNWIATR